MLYLIKLLPDTVRIERWLQFTVYLISDFYNDVSVVKLTFYLTTSHIN